MVGLVRQAVQGAGPRRVGPGLPVRRVLAQGETATPTKFDLDPVSPDNPVILYHTSFHACVLNSWALEELGLTPETPGTGWAGSSKRIPGPVN